MSKKNDGGQAFPKLESLVSASNGATQKAYSDDGMSLRDYFAAHAPERPGGWWPNPRPAPLETWSPELHAAWAFAYADAILAAREKP